MAEFEINITIEHHDAFASDTVTAFAKTINEIAHLLFHNVHTTWNPIVNHVPRPATPVDEDIDDVSELDERIAYKEWVRAQRALKEETESAVNDAGFQVKGTRTGRLWGDPNFKDER